MTISKRQLNVLVNREVTDQVETLEDEADFLVANARALGKIQILNRLVVEHVAAPGRRIE